MNNRRSFWEERLANIKEELEAVQKQLSQTLSDRDKVRLNREAESLLQEIEKIEKYIQEIKVTVNNTIHSLFTQSNSPRIDWEWGKLILDKNQLPDINKRLMDTLGSDRHSLDISFTEQLQWVNRTLQIDGGYCETLNSKKLLIELLARKDINGKLLILGAPGSGKTTTLLNLAEQLVVGALDNPKTIIPVMFELSTWRDDNQSIEQWLVEQLYEQHGGDPKRKIYEKWVEERVLFPLMDGLDELGQERQKKCTIKLEEFAKHYPQVVACCRIKEFESVNLKLRTFRGAVCLQALTDIEIQEYFSNRNRPDLWSEIQKNSDLGQLLNYNLEGEPGLLRVPLFLKLIVDIYEPTCPISNKVDLLGKYIEHHLSIDTREGERRQDLAKREWAYKSVIKEPDAKLTYKTLSWVAQQLQANNTVELLIEKMQPSWLESKIRHYKLIFGLIYGLIFGLIFGLIYGLIFGLIYGLIFGLIYGLIFGLVFGQIFDPLIIPIETFQISLSFMMKRQTLSKLLNGLILGLILGLIYGLILELILGLIYGLILGLIFGLIFGLILELILGLKQELKERSRPNQGIWNSLRNMFLISIFTFVLFTLFSIFGILTGLFGRLKESYLILASILATVMYSCGGSAAIEHLALRIILWHQGLPWNFARFLNYCVERRLLLRVGGRYRFLHKELLDYFASLNV